MATIRIVNLEIEYSGGSPPDAVAAVLGGVLRACIGAAEAHAPPKGKPARKPRGKTTPASEPRKGYSRNTGSDG